MWSVLVGYRSKVSEKLWRGKGIGFEKERKLEGLCIFCEVWACWEWGGEREVCQKFEKSRKALKIGIGGGKLIISLEKRRKTAV